MNFKEESIMIKKVVLFLIFIAGFTFSAETAEENSVQETFNSYVKSDEFRKEYVETGIAQMYSIMAQKGKIFNTDMIKEEIDSEIASILETNFKGIKIEVKDSKTNKNGEIELTVNIEGKDVLNPFETNIISSTSQQIMKPDKFIGDFSRYMRMYSVGKKKIKLTYILQDSEWVLKENEDIKLLSALLLVKNFNE